LKKCNKCQHAWYDRFDEKKLKKVDFIWVNRNYKSFEWFIELLSKIELQQQNISEDDTEGRFIRIHLFITSEKEDKEFKYIDLSSKEMNKAAKKDCSLIMHSGRPDIGNVIIFYSPF
jgi:NADPH oxidase 5